MSASLESSTLTGNSTELIDFAKQSIRPRMHMEDGRVVSNFILQALQNLDITIYGDGKQTRSFQYVDDLVDGLIGLMNSGMFCHVLQ